MSGGDYREWMARRRIDRIEREDDPPLGVVLKAHRGDLHAIQFVPIGLLRNAHPAIDFQQAALDHMADKIDEAESATRPVEEATG